MCALNDLLDLTKVVSYMCCMSTSPEGEPHSTTGGNDGVLEQKIECSLSVDH